MADLAVIIVTWNVRDLIVDALRTLYDDLQSSQLDAQVIVVDSASSDGTVDVVRESFPQTYIIASQTNLGFAGGNNAGMAYLGFDGSRPVNELPQAVYLLNPDTLTHRGATAALYSALFASDGCGVVGAFLTYEDGSFQHSAFTFPGLRQIWVEFFPTPGRLIEGRFNGRYPQALYQAKQPFPVDFMLGATMMLHRDVILQTGMFDPQFFMYCEEIDWQWRIRKAGWQIQCVPVAHVTHLSGKSTSQAKPRSVINLWDSRLRLFRKHFASWKYQLACWLVMMGMRRKIKQQITQVDATIIEAYEKVIEMAQRA